MLVVGIAVLTAVSGLPGTSASVDERVPHARGQACAPGASLDELLDACGHGPDPARTAPDLDRERERRRRPLPTRIPCTPEDGGPVVRVFYGYDGRNQLDKGTITPRSLILQAVAAADQLYADAAESTGGVRHVRWHTPGCRLEIVPIKVAEVGPYAIDAAATALGRAGLFALFDPGDKFVVMTFYPAAYTSCGGVATVYDGSEPGQANPNNQLQTLSYVGCAIPGFLDARPWDFGEVLAHELTHALGSVQSGAPNSTPAGHCTDESDVMCYADGTGGPMRRVCPVSNPEQIDCNKDDYFNVSPPAGSYLDRNWNTADSRFLHDREPQRWQTLPRARARLMVPPIAGDRVKVVVKPVRVKGASVGSAVLRVPGREPMTDATPPFVFDVDLSSFDPGREVTLRATIVDVFGRRRKAGARTLRIVRPSVELTSPAEDLVFGLARVEAEAEPSEGATVRRVDFLVDGQVAASDTTAPYQASLDVAESYVATLAARVTDSEGRTALSGERTVTVTRPLMELPSGSLYPASRATDIAIRVTSPYQWVDVPDGRVDLLLDGSVIGSDATAPYIVSATMPDTGAYELSARFVTGGVTLATAYTQYIRTAPASGFVTIASPAPGPVTNPLTLSFTVAGGTPGQRSVTYQVANAYGTLGDNDGAGYRASLELPPGDHLLSSAFRPSISESFTGPSSVITVANPVSVTATIRRDGDAYQLGATVSGIPDGYTLLGVTWYVGSQYAGSSYEAPWLATWTPYQPGTYRLRAIAQVSDSVGAFVFDTASAPIVVTVD